MPSLEVNSFLETGHRLSNPIPGDEVVISGIAGRYPECDNVYELRDSLMNKVDLITDDGRRWSTKNPIIPQRTGKLKNLEKFDASFFGVSDEEANYMDPAGRKLLEVAYEAIVDAGLTPSYFRGSSTGVFIGYSFSEAFYKTMYSPEANGLGIPGCSKAMLANRISSWLDIKGPSFSVDTACSSSLYALDHAHKAIRDGHCEAALVGGANLCLHSGASLSFAKLGVLSPDGRCRCFDDSATGYVRAEAVSLILLQKKKHAKRIYGRVVHSKTNCDGFKEEGITFPSKKLQVQLLKELYEECGIPPESVAYVEAHGTGTKVGDSVEAEAIYSFFCKSRTEPLLVGSIKGNLGHSEPAAGLSGIAKACISFETGFIPPNINYSTPIRGAVQEGRLKVVTEITPLNGDLIGVSAFGFGGANCHVLIERNKKLKSPSTLNDESYLVVASGRTEHSVEFIFDNLVNRKLDPEFIRLINDAHQEANPGHPYRGYLLLTQNKLEETICVSRDIKATTENKRQLWWVFTGISEQSTIGKSLMKIRVFEKAIERCHQTLLPKGINVKDLVTDPTSSRGSNAMNSLIRTAAIHIGLVDILNRVGVKPDFIIGHSAGELGSAYADGCLTLEQTILVAYLLTREIDTTYSTNFVTHKLDLLNKINEVIPHPKTRSDKWLSFSSSRELCSSEYLVDSLFNSALLNHAWEIIPRNALRIEMGSLPDDLQHKQTSLNIINLIRQKSNDLISVLQTGLGKLYQAGFDLNLVALSPKVVFPVSRGTPMIAPLVKWNHIENRNVYKITSFEKLQTGSWEVPINIDVHELQYLSGHVIDGRNLFPATGYLAMVWEGVALMQGLSFTDLSVVFDDVQFLRATTIPKEGQIVFLVAFQRGTGYFEISQDGIAVVTGKAFIPIDIETEQVELEVPLELKNDIALTTDDIYKEFRLRGYNYNGAFRGMVSCDNKGTVGEILWEDNWVSFLDNMLQMYLLKEDTRGLFVPTRIQRLSINIPAHTAAIPEDSPKKTLKVYRYDLLDMIKSAGVEIRGLTATVINRRKPAREPVTECQKFTPYHCNDGKSLHEVMRIIINLALENSPAFNIKIVEILEDASVKLVAEDIALSLDDIAVVKAEISIFKDADVSLTDPGRGILIENKSIEAEDNNCFLIVGQELLKQQEVLQSAMKAVKQNGFLLSREKLLAEYEAQNDLKVICSLRTSDESFVLLKKKVVHKNIVAVNLDDEELSFGWLDTVKTAISNNKRVVLYADADMVNGILGFFNCLRREPGGDQVQCFFIMDKNAPRFNIDEEFYKNQLELNLAVNIYKDGQWGSYRYFLLEDNELCKATHAYVNTTARGDLSSLQWLQGPLNDESNITADEEIIQPYFASLNFRDIMLATSKLSVEAITKNRLKQDCVLGFEFSGKTNSGRRVMGFAEPPGVSSLVVAKKQFVWDVPDLWTLEEAATIPAVYATALHALITVGRIHKDMTVLIHAGSGGVGIAAINIALHYGCTVFTTVGTQKKREFIKKQFPQIDDRHIGNSRDTSFEQLVLKETKGRGVDLVLNSLADDKLLASVRCLAPNGRFLEIGKYDLMQNSKLGMDKFLDGVSHHGIMIDSIFAATAVDRQQQLYDLVANSIASGIVRPLPSKTFEKDDVEATFRYLAGGKHIGKVLLKVRNEEDVNDNIAERSLFTCKPRFYCDPNMSYVICGGLGGFGLEITDWLVLRGARKLVLTSRKGITTGYQAHRLSIWKSYGCTINICTADCTTISGSESLVQEANSMGPVAAIFNLAVVLQDALLENQTPEMFRVSFAPKVLVTKNLDIASRKYCPKLKHFIVFSSISCGRGNAGQTNYGMANSVMERICEARVREGLPGLAIQWGAIGEVGLVADMQQSGVDIEIAGTLPQNIPSCLEVLDKFLVRGETVVASTIVAEKRERILEDSVVEFVAKLIGVRDIRNVSSQTPLPELGMDSMMAVEMKQGLERDYGIFLTAQEIRDLTFARLQALSDDKNSDKTSSKLVGDATPIESNDFSFMISRCGTELETSQPIMQLPSNMPNDTEIDCTKPSVFLIPGIEGASSTMVKLASNLKHRVYCLQLAYQSSYKSVEDLANELLTHVASRIGSNSSFYIVGYSFGALIALQISYLLEKQGKRGITWLIDGAPDFSKHLMLEDKDFDMEVLTNLLHLTKGLEIKNLLKSLKTFEEKLELCLKMSPTAMPFSRTFMKLLYCTYYYRAKAYLEYNPDAAFVLESDLLLIKPTIKTLSNVEYDYGLSKYTKNPVVVHSVEGNHTDVVDNELCAALVNDMICKD